MNDAPDRSAPGLDLGPAPTAGDAVSSYRVLARKYRPATFDDLIGQDAMVRTISNAFETGRVPQAWILTGVRGVGKTTTARILARAQGYHGLRQDQRRGARQRRAAASCSCHRALARRRRLAEAGLERGAPARLRAGRDGEADGAAAPAAYAHAGLVLGGRRSGLEER